MLSKSQELVSAESVQDSLLCSANHPRQSGPLGRGEIHVPMVGMWRDSFGQWSWDSVLSTPVASISLAENAGLEVTRSQPSPANIAYATELCSFIDDVNEQERYQFQLGRVSLGTNADRTNLFTRFSPGCCRRASPRQVRGFLH